MIDRQDRQTGSQPQSTSMRISWRQSRGVYLIPARADFSDELLQKEHVHGLFSCLFIFFFVTLPVCSLSVCPPGTLGSVFSRFSSSPRWKTRRKSSRSSSSCVPLGSPRFPRTSFQQNSYINVSSGFCSLLFMWLSDLNFFFFYRVLKRVEH